MNCFRFIVAPSRNVCTSTRMMLDMKWRERKGLPRNPNAYGPLTNGPDFTYLDGRPTPIGPRLKARLQKQREIAEKIIQFSEEIDFAVQRHELKLKDEEDVKKKIIAGKLKPKGMPFKSNQPVEK
ncbi:39S ribosomal protein L52, mitochondrial [Ischnura elegans]|uniref:39S ribosomal protein L52, mitochondrial n=1 Tax=Ischnura elegans TaxID=197161 RepID=UPI001ED8B34E|nr:39S ribosomal protein L52, mitochondrial [Ischnura elegans]